MELFHHLSAADLSGMPDAWVFFVLFFATFASEDLACLVAGGLAASGETSFALAVSSCFAGIVAGDISLYWIGRVLGSRIFKFRFAQRFVSDQSLQNASVWLDKRGASAVFISRFITGLRLPTYLAAGMLKTNFSRFTFFFVLAAAVWTPLLVGVAYAGSSVTGSLLATVLAGFIIARSALKFGRWRNRRIAIGKLKRITRWEFWPLPIFYFPVVCYVLLLAIKHRSLTVFTNANPAIPASGFSGESKDEIYALLASSESSRKFVLNYRLVDRHLVTDEKLRVAQQFMREHELAFPVVVKPNAGERGKCVRIIRSLEELRRALRDTNEDLIVQEFFDGAEAGVFYYRFPGETNGRIFSITEKQFPTLTGDGVSTVETLILLDPRAVCLAEKYFEENADRLESIPPSGTRVPIIDIGTHSRGAIFLDGEAMMTDQLEQSIDQICRGIDGFYFGRFDIRFSSLDDFRAGRNFKIIELNGVTSESTNIYDPRYSLVDAYRILFAQWKIAFEVGSVNRRLGMTSTPVKEILRLAVASTFPKVAAFATLRTTSNTSYVRNLLCSQSSPRPSADTRR